MAAGTYALSAQAVVVPALSVFSIILSIPPLVWHSKNHNFPASCLVIWFLINNIFNIVNAAIWPTDDVDSWWSGVGLCDIEVKLMIASYVGVPGALMCIFRTLAHLLDTDRVVLVPSREQSRRRLAFEIFFCLVVPAISMITHYVVQKNRFMLYTIAGCVNSFDESWVTLVLSFIWPTVICLIAGYYCCLVLFRLWRYKNQFGTIFRSCDSSLSKSRFLRLFFLAFMTLLVILPAQAYVLYTNVEFSLPWHSYSWSKIHGPSWNMITKIATHGQIFFDRWIPIAGGILLFFFFGFGTDATMMYRSFLLRLGLGRCFPALSHPHICSSRRTSTSSVSPIVSFSSRAKLLFSRTQSIVSRTNSVSTEPFEPSSSSFPSKDLEKGFPSISNTTTTFPRRHQLWGLFTPNRERRRSRHRHRDTPIPRLPGSENTVSTTAWAGKGERRSSEADTDTIPSPSKNGIIKVKQMIRQTSEKR